MAKSGPLADANVYRFSSKEAHANSGLYYFGSRFYDPSLQRWLNRDPMGEPGGLNLYAFANNAGINGIDPWGLFFGLHNIVGDPGWGLGVDEGDPGSPEGSPPDDQPASGGAGEGPVGGSSGEPPPEEIWIIKYKDGSKPPPTHSYGIPNYFPVEVFRPPSDWSSSSGTLVGSSGVENAAERAGMRAGGPVGALRFVPILGSGLSAIHDFQTGHPFLGTFNAVMAVSDVFLVKAAAVAVGKIVVEGAVKVLAQDVAATVLKDTSGSAVERVVPQILKNKAAGDAFRDEIADLLREEGREVATEVYKKTPFGKRFIDIEVSQNGTVLGGIETKVGNSRYTPLQRAKDLWLWYRDGYKVNVVRNR